MASFQDNLNRTWNLNVTVQSLREIKRRVRDREGKPVDLMDLIFDELTLELLTNMHMVSDILWVLCEQQSKGLTVKDTEFFTALSGDTLENAQEALLEAIGDFFTTRQRTAFKEQTQRIQKLHEALWDTNRQRLENLATAATTMPSPMEQTQTNPETTPKKPRKSAPAASGSSSTAATPSSAPLPIA